METGHTLAFGEIAPVEPTSAVAEPTFAAAPNSPENAVIPDPAGAGPAENQAESAPDIARFAKLGQSALRNLNSFYDDYQNARDAATKQGED